MVQDFFWEGNFSVRGARIAGTYVSTDFEKNYTESRTPLKMWSSATRTMIPFGMPILDYRNKADRELEQQRKIGAWQVKMLQPQVDSYEEWRDGCNFYAGFPFDMVWVTKRIILQQVWWLVGSFSFLFVFAVIAMRSFFVALLGVCGVFFAIPCAVVVMSEVVGIGELDGLDVIALFLICGIGADCVFITFDLFR
jgi:hypothetical protein